MFGSKNQELYKIKLWTLSSLFVLNHTIRILHFFVILLGTFPLIQNGYFLLQDVESNGRIWVLEIDLAKHTQNVSINL